MSLNCIIPGDQFAAYINKCTQWYIPSYDSLRLSQAQILWGMYNKKNVELCISSVGEDFIFKELGTKNTKKDDPRCMIKTSAGTDRGSKRRRSGKEPASTSAPSETTTKTAGKTTSTGSKTHKKSASQSAPVEEAMQSTDVFEGSADQEYETGIHDEQAEEEIQHLPDWFQQPTRLPSPDHAWNKSVPAAHGGGNNLIQHWP
ncbi:hypothetical protein Tco_1174059 [Tanacetum coccineum]